MKPVKILLFLFFFLPIIIKAQSVFEIKFKAGITQYRGALVLYDDGTGAFRVKYFSDGQTRMVEQQMKVENTTEGMRLAGYNPVYPGTKYTYSNYNADNFYLTQDENGVYTCENIDDAGSQSKCNIRLISGDNTDKNRFLKDFDWSL
jgi:hypothetical protein